MLLTECLTSNSGTSDVRHRTHFQREIPQEGAVREELLQTGHHHGGAAEVEVLEPGLVDPLLTEDRLLQGGPRQSEDRAASVYHLARHPGGDG